MAEEAQRREREAPFSVPRALWRRARRHPVISAVLLSCTLLGALCGAWLLTGEWSLARRLAAGAVAGAGAGFLVTATKMLD